MAAVKSKTEQLIEACKRTSEINRGMYPITKASNVFKEDGTSLEPAPAEGEGDEEGEEDDDDNDGDESDSLPKT